MTTAKPPARYSAMESARSGDFAPVELHHPSGHDRRNLEVAACVRRLEKGMNRMGARRLHHIARVLDVPIEFFYEGASSDQGSNGPIMIDGQSRSMTDFLATSEGLELVRAFTAIKDPKVRLRIVDLAKAAANAE